MLGLTIASGALAQIAPPVQPENADPVAGSELYAEHCAACHGAELEGEPNWRSPKADGTLPAPPHDASGHTWHHGDGLLFDYTRLGGQVALEQRGISGFQSGMPGFGDVLSDDEIWNILAFIKASWPEEALQFQADQTRAEQGQ